MEVSLLLSVKDDGERMRGRTFKRYAEIAK